MYHLPNKLSQYDNEIALIVAKWTKSLELQMKSLIFHSFDLISILIFLLAPKLASDMNGVCKGAIFWLHILWSAAATTELNTSVRLKFESNTRQ